MFQSENGKRKHTVQNTDAYTKSESTTYNVYRNLKKMPDYG